MRRAAQEADQDEAKKQAKVDDVKNKIGRIVSDFEAESTSEERLHVMYDLKRHFDSIMDKYEKNCKRDNIVEVLGKQPSLSPAIKALLPEIKIVRINRDCCEAKDMSESKLEIKIKGVRFTCTVHADPERSYAAAEIYAYDSEDVRLQRGIRPALVKGDKENIVGKCLTCLNLSGQQVSKPAFLNFLSTVFVMVHGDTNDDYVVEEYFKKISASLG